MGRILSPDQQGVRRLRRPAGQIGGAKIRGVELRSRDLGDAVDAAGPGRGGIQRCRPGNVSRAANPGSSALANRDRLSTMPLGRRRLDELAARNAHFAATLLFSGTGPSPDFLEKRGMIPRQASHSYTTKISKTYPPV